MPLFRRIFLSGALILAVTLTGCTPKKAIEAVGKMAKVAMDPDMPIGPPKDEPSKATFTVYSEPGVNKNAYGESSPMDVWLVQLSDEGKFLTTDFETLTADMKSSLGPSYVSHKQIQAEPNKSKIISDWEIAKETRLIGVISGYKDIDRTDWRTIENINPTGENYKIVIVTKAKYVLLEVHR